MSRRVITSVILAASALLLHSCYYARGVVAPKVTDKVVARSVADMERHQGKATLKPYLDSVPAWQPGKRLYVTDDQARLMLATSPAYDTDTLHLGGKVLTYQGYTTGSVLDNNADLNLNLTDGRHTYVLPTHKTASQFASDYTLPFIIDMDMVQHFARQLVGKEIYVKTSIWYDPATQEMIDGRKYIKVRVDSVLPGNKVLPLRVIFTATGDGTGQRAMQWMSNGMGTQHSRDFDALFSIKDPHDSYPQITDEVWHRITLGQVAIGMTKEECRLAKGSPKSILQDPDSNGLHEWWFYDGGGNLYFVDGVLEKIR